MSYERPDWDPMFVHDHQLVVCRGEEPLDKLPPAGELSSPGLHWTHWGTEVVLLGEEIRAEPLDGGGSVLTDNPPAVLDVVIVLLQAGVLPQPL